MAKQMDFEQRMNRIEEIAAALEKGDATLKESMTLFAEGTALIGQCREELDKAQQQVVQLMTAADGAVEEVPFAAEEQA